MFVQFSAEWCMPCQSIEGNLTEFATTYADKMTFVYLDADNFEDIFAEFEIANMPTFKIFKSGADVATQYGTKVEKIKELIEKNI